MLYFLIYSTKQRRQMIVDEQFEIPTVDQPQQGDANRVLMVEASSWIEAKFRLGFDLTPLQSFMLSTKEAV